MMIRGEKSFRYQIMMNIISDVCGGYQCQKVAEAIYSLEKPSLENIIQYFIVRGKGGNLSRDKNLFS